MGSVQSTLAFDDVKRRLHKSRIYRCFHSVLSRRKQNPAPKKQSLVEFLGNFPSAPDDWSNAKKVLLVTNETATETPRAPTRQSKGLKWIVSVCILQGNDPHHTEAKWAFVKLDTQAEHSVIFASQAKSLGLDIIYHTTRKYQYYGINDQGVACVGSVNISFKARGCDKIFDAKVDVLEDSHTQEQVQEPRFSMLLGQELINRYQWVQPNPELNYAIHLVHRKTEFHK